MIKRIIIIVLLLNTVVYGWTQNVKSAHLKESKYEYKLEYNILSYNLLLSGEWVYTHLTTESKFTFLNNTKYTITDKGEDVPFLINDSISTILENKSINMPSIDGISNIINKNKQLLISLSSVLQNQSKDTSSFIMTTMIQLITSGVVCSNINELMGRETITISDAGIVEFSSGKSSYYVIIDENNLVTEIRITTQLEKDGRMVFILKAYA